MSDIPAKAIDAGFCDKFGDNEIIMEKDSEVQSESSCFLMHNVLEEFDNIGSKTDLYVLRQLNPEYYEKLNPTFLDSTAKSIRVVKQFKTVKSADEGFVQDQLLKLKIMSEWKTNFVIEGVTPTNDNDDDEQRIKKITPQNWTPKIAHIFRKLELDEVWISNDSKNGHPLLYKIITQVAPFITSLKVNTLPQDPKKHGKTMSKFLKTFPNLHILSIDVISMLKGSSGRIFQLQRMGETFGQLEVGIANLNSNLKIHLKVNLIAGFQDFLNKFAKKQNTTIHLEFFHSSLLGIVKNIFTEFGNLKNIRYSFKLDKGFKNLADLQTFTGFCTQLKDQLEEFILTLPFDVAEHSFEDADEVGIRNCLAQLSPYINLLSIWSYTKEWDILPHGLLWPKLTQLWIVGYHFPLEILKTCSSLQILYIFMDSMDECIFSNPQQSEKKSLDEYFGNLPRLCKLTFFSRLEPTDKFAPGNELDEYLKSLLPGLKTIEYKSPINLY